MSLGLKVHRCPNLTVDCLLRADFLIQHIAVIDCKIVGQHSKIIVHFVIKAPNLVHR